MRIVSTMTSKGQGVAWAANQCYYSGVVVYLWPDAARSVVFSADTCRVFDSLWSQQVAHDLPTILRNQFSLNVALTVVCCFRKGGVVWYSTKDGSMEFDYPLAFDEMGSNSLSLMIDEFDWTWLTYRWQDQIYLRAFSPDFEVAEPILVGRRLLGTIVRVDPSIYPGLVRVSAYGIAGDTCFWACVRDGHVRLFRLQAMSQGIAILGESDYACIIASNRRDLWVAQRSERVSVSAGIDEAHEWRSIVPIKRGSFLAVSDRRALCIVTPMGIERLSIHAGSETDLRPMGNHVFATSSVVPNAVEVTTLASADLARSDERPALDPDGLGLSILDEASVSEFLSCACES